MYMCNCLVIFAADNTQKDSKDVDLASMLPFNPDLIRPDTFPKYEPEQTFDDEGNLMLGDLPLKKFDVEPLDIDAYIKEFEVQPILKLKVNVLVQFNVLYFSLYT